ncbi:MAG: peptide ligase PGM1-related protein [Thermoanaerobaculia bacterium]
MASQTIPREWIPEAEAAEFERLKGRMIEVWKTIGGNTGDSAYTSVVVPSLTLDQDELRKIPGAAFYEERLLFLLMRLRNPRARLVYVTSQPVHPLVLEYYLQLLAGIPASHARSRLTLLCAYDSSSRSLTEKILERPRLIERIRAGVQDPSRAFLTVFNSTPLERRLAVLLGIPLFGCDPALMSVGTKSGGRKVFAEAGIAVPAGFEELRSPDDVVRALAELKKVRPCVKRAVVKLNGSFSGEGNVVFRYPPEEGPDALAGVLDRLEFPVATESFDSFFGKFDRMGGVVEEFLEGEERSSPSSQLLIEPGGKPVLLSTHDQILGGPAGQLYLGCRFPARQAYRREVGEAGLRVGEVLAQKGVIGRFGIDTIVRPKSGGGWEVYGVEINLRKGGTTHPFLALQFLTGGAVQRETGLFVTPSGHPKYYRSTDTLSSPRYRGLLPEDLIEILTANSLHYSPITETGVLFHMIGALSQYGKVGLTVIGNSREEAETLYEDTLQVLDRETTYRTGGLPAALVSPE